MKHHPNCGCWAGWYDEWALCQLIESGDNYNVPNYPNWWYQNRQS